MLSMVASMEAARTGPGAWMLTRVPATGVAMMTVLGAAGAQETRARRSKPRMQSCIARIRKTRPGVERTAANTSGIGFQFSLFGRR